MMTEAVSLTDSGSVQETGGPESGRQAARLCWGRVSREGGRTRGFGPNKKRRFRILFGERGRPDRVGSRKNPIWAMPTAALEAIIPEERPALSRHAVFAHSKLCGARPILPSHTILPSPPSALLAACYPAEAALHGCMARRLVIRPASTCSPWESRGWGIARHREPCCSGRREMIPTASRSTRSEWGGWGIQRASQARSPGPVDDAVSMLSDLPWASSRPRTSTTMPPRNASPTSDRTPSPHGSGSPPCARGGRQASWWSPSSAVCSLFCSPFFVCRPAPPARPAAGPRRPYSREARQRRPAPGDEWLPWGVADPIGAVRVGADGSCSHGERRRGSQGARAPR